MRTRVSIALAILCAAVCGAVPASAVTWTTEVSCPYNGDPGDVVDRGFYVTHYAGNNLSQVQLLLSPSVSGNSIWKVTLTAHRGAFNGPIIGTPQIATPFFSDGPQFVVFDFGGAAVTPGDTIAFTIAAQQISGPASVLLFDVGNGTSCANVFETNGTSPPLDTVRRNGLGVVITQQVISSACVPSDTVLCADDNPGDHRFKITVSFHTSQAGGLSGNGQATALADHGIFRGGSFWFFSQDNPEMLIKVLDGCGLNGHFWVYFSAGTNVGFTVTVHDMVTGHNYTYTNPDLTQAPPVQNANALSCS